MFSTLQFQQQDLIKGLYFNLSTVPATYPPPSSPPVQFLETLVPARLAGCDPRYRALSYFQLTSSLAPRLPPTAGYTPWGEPDNRNWPLSEETPHSVAALRERSVQINPCNYGGGSGRRDIYRVFFQMIFFKMWNYSWRNGILINGGLIETRREITSLDHVCVARFIYFSVFKIRPLD